MSFISPQFTNAGKKLQARALSGDAQITFTQMGLGDGELATQSISALTDLINPIKKIDISDLRVINPDQVQLKAVFQNIGMVGFFWREVGLFAADPDNPDDRTKDILYCYQNAQDLAEYIPSGDSQLVDKILNMSVVVADATQVKISFFSESYALKEDLEEQTASLKKDLDDHKSDETAHSEVFEKYLPLTGGTLSGDLSFNDTYSSYIDNEYESGKTYDEDKWSKSFIRFCDKNLKRVAFVQNVFLADGENCFCFFVKNGDIEKSLKVDTKGGITWDNQNLVRSVNGNKADSKGNVNTGATVIEQQTNERLQTSYRLWSNGFLEQWGVVYSAAKNASETITMLKPFKDYDYTLVTGISSTANTNIYIHDIFNLSVAIIAKTTTSFTIISTPSDGGIQNWYACGQGA